MEKYHCENCKKEFRRFELNQIHSFTRKSKDYICNECLKHYCDACGKYSEEIPTIINNGDMKICKNCLPDKIFFQCTDCGSIYTKDFWFIQFTQPVVHCIKCDN
ncbi:MAG: hypothetical protein WCR55_08725 [Lentisphaerota bacterium]